MLGWSYGLKGVCITKQHVLLSLTCVTGLFLAQTEARLVFTLPFLSKLDHSTHLRRYNKLTVGYRSRRTVSSSVIIGVCCWSFLAPTVARLVFTLPFLAKLDHSAHLRPSNKLTESMAVVVIKLSVVVLLLACVVGHF